MSMTITAVFAGSIAIDSGFASRLTICVTFVLPESFSTVMSQRKKASDARVAVYPSAPLQAEKCRSTTAIGCDALRRFVVDSASSLAPTERLLSRRNGCRTRRAQDREGSTAANELCPIERPETGRPEIEHRGFTTLRRSAADQFELRLLSQRHGLNPSVPRLGAIGDLCRTRHRWPGCVISRSGCRHVLSRNSQRGLCNDADPFALLASPQVPCQSSTPACCVPVIAICASI